MSARAALAERLRVPADQLSMLDAYDDAHVAQIDGAIREAFEAEDRAFTKAVEHSLDLLPRLIRPIAKKMMLGG